MPAWGEGTHTNPQKSIFWKVLHNKKSLEQFFFVLSFISSCQLLPDPSLGQMKEKSIDSKKLEKHADRPKFPNKKTFPQNPNILCDFFVQFNCRIEFCNILCRRAWLYIYAYTLFLVRTSGNHPWQLFTFFFKPPFFFNIALAGMFKTTVSWGVLPSRIMCRHGGIEHLRFGMDQRWSDQWVIVNGGFQNQLRLVVYPIINGMHWF